MTTTRKWLRGLLRAVLRGIGTAGLAGPALASLGWTPDLKALASIAGAGAVTSALHYLQDHIFPDDPEPTVTISAGNPTTTETNINPPARPPT
jgi:hypothetical protein